MQIKTITSKATRILYTILRQISTHVPREFGAAKLHMTLELASGLLSFAVVEDAAHHDSTRASVCTNQLVQGDILVADRAYWPSAFEIYPIPRKVEAQLFATRRCGARKPLAEEEASLAPGTVWDSRSSDFTGAKHEKPLFSASFELRQRPQWDSKSVKPSKMGIFTSPTCLEGLKSSSKTFKTQRNIVDSHDYNTTSHP